MQLSGLTKTFQFLPELSLRIAEFHLHQGITKLDQKTAEKKSASVWKLLCWVDNDVPRRKKKEDSESGRRRVKYCLASPPRGRSQFLEPRYSTRDRTTTFAKRYDRVANPLVCEVGKFTWLALLLMMCDRADRMDMMMRLLCSRSGLCMCA